MTNNKHTPPPRKRIKIRPGIDPDDERRLGKDRIASKHMRTTYFITKRFSDVVADMTEAGETDSDIVIAAADVAHNLLRIALMACIARHSLPYHQARRLADGVLEDLFPSMRKSICDQIEAWAITSKALAAANNKRRN